MLYAGHRDRQSVNWPDTFIKVYVEDALNERWRVTVTAHGVNVWLRTLSPLLALSSLHHIRFQIPSDKTLGSGSPLMGSDEDNDNTELEYSVFPRYATSYETVEALVLEAIEEQIQRRLLSAKGF